MTHFLGIIVLVNHDRITIDTDSKDSIIKWDLNITLTYFVTLKAIKHLNLTMYI